ncbi:hypothetical protein [Gracilinema caldarium]|uniref:Outer membrane protein beta-barrel domain-containing protein n=1 Tax=Gracilinema caldarium (strain ATCC 51460 / DSM 7334 / H1) TaxID=744872 RepID=F8EZ68_GRAC1|nr:hypothetical protein [Gracilinema caldarium]AEJ19660.1 hypothetical protein Spica_1516 [Gracilinema caldarium DSM 7334]
MALSIKKALTLTVLAATVVTSGFSQASPTSIADVQKGAESMAEALASALPFNSTLGLNWSDAYIGQFIGIPPHFGVGLSAGATSVKSDEMKVLLDKLGVDTQDLPEILPLPAGILEARIGGFILPFDIGLKAGFITGDMGKAIEDTSGGLKLDYILVGGDFRYNLIKGNLLLPRVSLGVGVNYMKGSLGTTLSGGQSFSYNNYNNYYINTSAPELGLSWETTTIDLKAQVSKSLLIFTPYAGLGASYGMSKAGYYVKSEITTTGGSIDDIKNALTQAGITPPDISATEMSSYFDNNGWAFRAFGGLSLNILVLKLDLTGLYNFSDGSYGGTLGVRFQL